MTERDFNIDDIELEEAINWNRIEDEKDLEVWNRLVNNFWVPEKIPLSNDLPSWSTLTDAEKLATVRVFTGLTLLDTIQGKVGAISLIPDAITPHEESVYANIAFMESLSGETELLTPTGWKNIVEIQETDHVAQYDPETNLISFVNPKIVPSHFDNEVYEISSNNGNAKQVVSGGHRVYYEEKEELNNQCNKWIPKVAEAREIAKINLNGFRRFRTSGIIESGEPMSVIDRLLVAIQADGSFKAGSSPRYTGEKTGTIPAYFTLSKIRKIDRLHILADEAGWKLVENSPTPKKGNQKEKRNFKLYVPLEYVSIDKIFTDWWKLDKISLEWGKEFIEEISQWDGHHLKQYDGIQYTTTVKENADFVEAVSSLVGYRSRTTIRTDNRAENFSDTYNLYIAKTKDTVSGQSISIIPTEPQQMYCVQVPSTFILTKNGAGTVITGNCVHAKSYSSIFSTLISTSEIDDAFRWSKENTYLKKKAAIILNYYRGADPEKRKIASTLLESFLFYSGFFLPLWWSSKAKLSNTADIIRLIIRDEAVHGYYIGYKFQLAYKKASPERQQELYDFTISLLKDLYENEEKYTEELYDSLGLTEEVKTFLKYNANKALNNLGFEGIFSKEETNVIPQIISALNPAGEENHDFFSGQSTSYVIGKAEETEDDDWDF